MRRISPAPAWSPWLDTYAYLSSTARPVGEVSVPGASSVRAPRLGMRISLPGTRSMEWAKATTPAMSELIPLAHQSLADARAQIDALWVPVGVAS